MKIAVMANGTWDLTWGNEVLADVDYLVCADGGADHAMDSGRIPDMLVGDMDSVSAETLKRCEEGGCLIRTFPCEKDETDLELALHEAGKKAGMVGERDIWLYGATGGRIDHLLGNTALLLAFARKGYRVRMADARHEIWVAQNEEQVRGSAGQVLSLLALSEQATVTTKGLYYPLTEGILRHDSTMGLSNVFLGEEAGLQIHSGWVLAVLPRGKNM